MKVKCAIALLSFLTAVAFFYGTLPEHYDVRGVNDDVLWALVFAALAIAHWVGLRWHDCYTCRVWSDTLVQIQGLAWIAASGAFVSEYPPFNWAMAVFPILGGLCVLLGRWLNKRTRAKIVRGANE